MIWKKIEAVFQLKACYSKLNNPGLADVQQEQTNLQMNMDETIPVKLYYMALSPTEMFQVIPH